IAAASDLARAHIALGQTSEAIVQFRAAVGLADALDTYDRGQADRLIAERHLDDAIQHLRTALEWNPKDQRARRTLGYTLNELGRHDEALQVWRELDESLEGDGEALRNIAGIALARRQPAEAAGAFRKLMTIEPDPGEIAKLEAAVRELEGGAAGA